MELRRGVRAPAEVGALSFASGDTLAPPSIAVGVALGAPTIIGGVEPPSIAVGTAPGAPTVAEFGIVMPSISTAVEMTFPGVGGELTLNHISAVARCRLGAPRITSSSIMPPSIGVPVAFGSITLVKVEPPSIEVGVELGAPSLTSPLLVAMPALAACELGLPSVLDAGRPYSLLLANEDRTAYWELASGISITLGMNGKSSMRFTLVDPANAYRPGIGYSAEFFFGETKLFGGIVEDIEESAPTGANTAIKLVVHCNGWGSILDRRVVFGYWDSHTGNAGPGLVVDSIRVNFLAADGFFTLSAGLQDSPEFDTLFLAPMTATEAYNRVSGATGIDYYVDPHKTIRWINPATGHGSAPVSIVQADNAKRLVADSVRVRSLSGLYRNRTYVNLSRAISPEFTETLRKAIPSPQNMVFYATFPITEKPTVTIHGTDDDYVVPDVLTGPAGLPSEGWDAFFQVGEFYVTLNPLADFWDVIGGLVSVEATYTIMDGLTGFVYADNAAEIEARGNIEGGTGLWETVENATDVETREQAEDLAEALTERYSSAGIPKEVSFDTFVPGWQPGQLLTLDLTRPLAQGDFLVTDVAISEEGSSLIAETPFLKYSIKASNNGLLRRRQQNVQANRGRAIDSITFAIARTITGQTNPGLAVGDNITGTHTVTQGGLFADAHLIFEDAPDGADIVLVVQIAEPEANTFTDLVTLTYADGRTSLLVAPIEAKARRGQRIRINCTQVGSEEPGANGTLRLRILQ